MGAPAGAPSDTAARAFAPFLERHLPYSRLRVVNIPGDAGLAGFRALARADPSGMTFGWVVTPVLPARMVDRPEAGNLLDRLRLIGAVAKEPIAFVSSANSPLASAADLVGRSADDAAAVPLATPPAGSPPHLAALRLQALAGTTLNIVAFPSAAAARQAALSRHAAAAALGLGDAVDCLRNGTLTGLGIAARNRPRAFPDIAPLREGGLQLSAVIHRGLAAPYGCPEDLAGQLRMALQSAVADPEYQAAADAGGFAGAFLDGPAWTAQAAAERAELAALWVDTPWLPSGVG
ncbi:tripartite tricarboxylate transporter substrate-binding protein [Rhodovastum sp. RN2-1]|uniref:Tripartite tricarboxylate transporter substrate-binding protein n=1 Tax=Limobrevibacterium gyesilva TaxID=2991712 RepID=A0AA41YKM1_9PROT|nr:tripartite tricarboxylate transporter substrate-binding protein [Limobrevibacterium gyesilva]